MAEDMEFPPPIITKWLQRKTVSTNALVQELRRWADHMDGGDHTGIAQPHANPAIAWTQPHSPARHTHYVWEDDQDCPIGWMPVCRWCGGGPLTGDDEGAGVCADCAAQPSERG